MLLFCYICACYCYYARRYTFVNGQSKTNTRFYAKYSLCSYGAKTDILAPQVQKSECEKCTSPIQIHGKRNEIQSKLVKQGLAYSIRHTTNLISLYFVAGCTAKNRNSKVHLYL